MILLLFAFFVMLFIPGCTAQVTSVSLVAFACNILDNLFTFIGLFEVIAVFSEDFKVKIMQVAMFCFDWIETFKLNRLTISYFEGILHSRLVPGQFSLTAFLGLCAYMAVGLVATCKLFSKQELGF